MISHKSL